MNTEERELEQLREIARLARIQPDDVAVARLRARVADRLGDAEPLWDAIVAFFRPVAVALLALLVVLGVVLSQQLATDSTDLLARSMPVISAEQEIYGD